MKILFLSDGIYPFVIGGMQKHSRNLVKHLVLKGHEVKLIHQVAHNEKIPTDQEVYQSIFGGDQSVKFKSKCFHFPKPGKIPGHYIRNSYQFSLDVYNYITKEIDSYDFIYIKGFSGWKLLEEKNKGRKYPKTGIKFHGYEMFQMASGFKNKLEHLLLRDPVVFNNINADYVFSYGGRITRIIEDIGVSSKQIVEITSAIEDSWLFDRKKEVQNLRNILFVGRYERRKGLSEFHQAIQKLNLSIKNLNFWIVGDVPESVRLNLGNVKYFGKMKNESEIKELYRKSDVFICPSYSEGMPNTILEAMASKCAILATDVGANLKMISQENGWILDRVDPNLIMEHLQLIAEISDENLKAKQNSSYKRIKEEFLWGGIAETTIKFLEGYIYK